MPASYVEMFQVGREKGPFIAKPLGTQLIQLKSNVEVDFPPGFDFLLPVSLQTLFLLRRRPIATLQDIDEYMHAARGIRVRNAEVAVSIPRDPHALVNTLVSKNPTAPAFFQHFARLHEWKVMLQTINGITLYRCDTREVVPQVVMPERPQRYGFHHDVRQNTI